MKIFLIGFMGSGKTTIGKSLSRLLNVRFIDMDDYIQDDTGLSINEIFEKHGESWFRNKETETLKELSEKTEDIVISTGGGTPCFGNNIEIINQEGISFYLQLNPKAFADRVYNPNTKRPLLKGKSKEELIGYAKEMMAKRAPFYSQASYTIDAVNLKPETIANVIRTHLEKH